MDRYVTYVKPQLILFLGALFSLSGCSSDRFKNEPKSEAVRVKEIQRFGAIYQPIQGVDPSQAQVIFYRGAAPRPGAKWPAAHLYVDRDFHSALLPTGFTRFCLKPGVHTLEAYLDDAPLYQGKRMPGMQTTLKGGHTYFLKVTEENDGIPTSVRRVDAEQALANNREQIHAVSRARAVETCKLLEQVPTAFPQPPLTLTNQIPFKIASMPSLAQNHGALPAMGKNAGSDHTYLKSIPVVKTTLHQ